MESEPLSHTKTILPKLKINKILVNNKLKQLQGNHAILQIILTTLGLVAAIAHTILGNPWNPIDMGIFLGFFIPIGIGVGAGFHRLFSHRSFKTAKSVRILLAILGSMAGQGSVIFWATLHRRHHACSDEEGDPHSPHLHGTGVIDRLKGLWHSYIGWTFNHDVPNSVFYSNDLIRDQAISRINRQYYFWVLVGLILPAGLGALLHQSINGAITGLIWGGLFRMWLWHNMIWSITSIHHVIGKRVFQTDDKSTNIFWLFIPTMGECWHNNHHAFPNAAIISFKWWQVDICGSFIQILGKLGLAWDLGKPTRTAMAKKRIVKV